MHIKFIIFTWQPKGGGGVKPPNPPPVDPPLGYDFLVITIDTGYLNRPNWLLAGYSVYHKAGLLPSPQCLSGPRSRHQRRDGDIQMLVVHRTGVYNFMGMILVDLSSHLC